MLLVFFSVTSVAQTKAQHQLESIENQRFEAMTNKNSAVLQNILADDLTYTHSNGLAETKAQHIENIRTGTIVYQSMQPEEVKVKVYRKTGIITGVVNVKGILKEKEFDIRLRYTDVYIKKRGKWKLVAWQSVRAD